MVPSKLSQSRFQKTTPNGRSSVSLAHLFVYVTQAIPTRTVLTRTLIICTGLLFGAVSLCAQSTTSTALSGPFLGPLFSYHVSMLSPEGEVESGARLGVGGVFTVPLSKTSELRTHVMYRSESGSFKTFQGEPVQTAIVNSLNVIEPGAKPYISSDVSLSAIELGASYWLRVAAIDSMGTNVYVGAGVFGDRILSGKQVDNYAAADIAPNEPIERTYNFTGQFGGGGFIGASMVFPLGSGRLGFDATYVIRTPSKIDGQNIEWLNGRCIRFGVHYDFGL